MRSLQKLFSFTYKIVGLLILKVLPLILRFTILSISILSKRCRHLSCRHRYTSTINKKAHKSAYTKRVHYNTPEPIDCTICLSEFEEGDTVRRLVDCNHSFHGHCLEDWLLLQRQATCPLCRSTVVPAAIVAEYRRAVIEQENDIAIVEKELAIILLNCCFRGRRCM